MLSYRVDQFEFDNPSTEEVVEIDVSRQSVFPHPDVSSFVGAVVSVQAAESLPEPTPFNVVHGRAEVRQHVKRFADIEIPTDVAWPTYRLDTHSPDEVLLVLCAPGFFIRYQWSTSA